MPALVLPLAEIAPHLPRRGALVGLDLGTKTVGVAVSDSERRLAVGVETISRKNFRADAARLLELADERRAVGFVLGLPVNMDGSEGPRAQSTRAFARNLAQKTELPIALWDERWSTAPRAFASASALRKVLTKKLAASCAPGKSLVVCTRSAMTACAPSPSRPSARSTSRHMTLPEPSQIALSGASR